MKAALLGCVVALAALPAAAKDKIIVLADGDAAALQGKTIALTVHERPSFVAMTAGKGSFGLFGVGAMIKAGNNLVDDNHVADPAAIVRGNLSAALADAFGARLLPTDASATKAEKSKDIAATHPEADYVLDVRSGGWNYAYFPTKWGNYWIGYSVQVQLVDTKTARPIANAACNSSTHDDPNPPSREQLHADGAKLLKDVTAALGWKCVQLLAKDELHIPADKVAVTPTEYVNPLAMLASAHGATAGATSTAPAPDAPVQQSAAEPASSDAPGVPQAVPPADASTAGGAQ